MVPCYDYSDVEAALTQRGFSLAAVTTRSEFWRGPGDAIIQIVKPDENGHMIADLFDDAVANAGLKSFDLPMFVCP